MYYSGIPSTNPDRSFVVCTYYKFYCVKNHNTIAIGNNVKASIFNDIQQHLYISFFNYYFGSLMNTTFNNMINIEASNNERLLLVGTLIGL